MSDDAGGRADAEEPQGAAGGGGGARGGGAQKRARSEWDASAPNAVGEEATQRTERPAKRAAVAGAEGRGYDETARRQKRRRPADAGGADTRKFQKVHIAVARPRAMERLNRLARGDG